MMDRPLRLHALLVTPLLFFIMSAALFATTYTVTAQGDGYYTQPVFTPSTLQIHVGDTVTFRNLGSGAGGGMHNAHADDDSFQCSVSCSGPNNTPNNAAWSFDRTFTQTGTVAYHCDMHVAQGMTGTITVLPAAGNPGTIDFSQPTYTASEASGAATITVNRSGGKSGAVSVHFATAAGTAVTGKNYNDVSGTLSFADGDGAAKTFSVPLLDDHVVASALTVKLTLSSPTGGAGLGTASSTLDILDADAGGGPPAAPTALVAAAVDTSSIQLSWNDNSNNEVGFEVQSRALDGSSFGKIATAPAGSGKTAGFLVTGLNPATGYAFQVRAVNASGNSAFTNEAFASTDAVPAPCVADGQTLCLGSSGRFQVKVAYVAPTGSGSGTTVPLATIPDSGLFYFFDAGNIEMLIKVLNACSAPFNHYWVFFAATTNVQFTVTVIDTTSGAVQTYFNPLNQPAAAVQDTSAFATCP
jgi:plastocyanin